MIKHVLDRCAHAQQSPAAGTVWIGSAGVQLRTAPICRWVCSAFAGMVEDGCGLALAARFTPPGSHLVQGARSWSSCWHTSGIRSSGTSGLRKRVFLGARDSELDQGVIQTAHGLLSDIPLVGHKNISFAYSRAQSSESLSRVSALEYRACLGLAMS